MAILLFFPLLVTLSYTSASNDHVALLAFKSLLNDPHKALSSWNSTSSHHCHWYGVSCNTTTNNDQERVTSLQLEALSLSGPISPALSNLTFLQKLHLRNNSFHGSIPVELGHLRTLVNLNLSMNSLSGEIPASLGGCTNLQGLSMRENKLQGTIPVNISRLLNLQQLDFRNNDLQGEIPPELGGLPKLQSLFLQTNRLTGTIPPSLSNLTSLTNLRLSYNRFHGAIPPELNRITGLRILDFLSNQLSGEVPPIIYNFSEVYGFQLADNLLKGKLPQDIGTYLPKVEWFSLYDNQFEGPLPASISNASRLKYLQLDGNSFSGIVPPTLGSIPTLVELNLGPNRFEARSSHDWRFMDSLTNCSKLEQVDLVDNLFGGSFPQSVANLSRSMKFLRVKMNRISGEIPEGISNLQNLQNLFLDTNLLTGPIPASIGQLPNLGLLSLYSNNLSGEIPESICNITTIVYLYLSLNRLTGRIPPCFRRLQLLGAVDLSHNKLTGEIPSGLLKISSLTIFLNLSGNSLTGNLPVEVGSLSNLKELDVSDNNLTGEIPSSVGKCLLLAYLHLGGNAFQGRIPQSFANLKGLQMLNLSDNNLSGGIPSFLTTLPDLTYLNLSFNHLEGEVPREGVFSNASLVSLKGNEKLCGGLSVLELNPCSDSDGGDDGRKHVLVIVIPVLAAVVLSVVLIVVVVLCVSRRSTRLRRGTTLRAPSLRSRHSQVSYKELCKATDGFSSANLIGSGSHGSVYRGHLARFKKMVAVKVLDCEQQGALSGFAAECEVLRNIRHRNLLRVFTSCSTVDNNGDDFKALVYEYMPKGSLDYWLHGAGSIFLGLRERVKIGEDVALALDYLHHQGSVPVVHSDLKPSNILLDEDMTAQVGDFGLARFLKKKTSVEVGRSSTHAIKGTVGYIAPEYGMGSPISREGDVYSFGILILEMLTGKRPIDEELGEGINLHIHASSNYPDHVQDIIDPRLLGKDDFHRISEEEQECMSLMVGIGLACSREVPSARIDTKQVLQQFALIKDILGAKP